MKLLCTMGCGRSKLANKSNADAPENETNDYYHKKSNNIERRRRSSGGSVEEVKIASSKSSLSSVGSGRSSLTSNGDLNKHAGKENKDITSGSKYNDRNKSGLPLQANPSITNSQLEFFRMLDEKIEKGGDYEEIGES